MKKLAVLGSPIEHSRSPAIHQAAYEVLGLSWQYARHQCEVKDLEAFLASLDASWIGFSCTMPLKEEARRLATSLDEVASNTGVVNTLIRTAEGWHGANTDVGGLTMALQEAQLDLSHTVILGAGATAVSAVLAAQHAGAQTIVVQARREEAAEQLATRMTRKIPVFWGALGEVHDSAPSPTTVVSTLPGQAGHNLALPEAFTQAALFDVAYDPWPSPLTEWWQSRSGKAISGIGMLVFQAVLQIRLFVHGNLDQPLPHENRVIEAMSRAATRFVGE